MNKLTLIFLLGATMALRINKSAHEVTIGSNNIDPSVEEFFDKHMNGQKVANTSDPNVTAKAAQTAVKTPAPELALASKGNISDAKMNGYVHDFVENIVPGTNTGRDENAPALNGPQPAKKENATAAAPEVKKA